MKIPFTTEQFFNVFEKYNTVVFPFQMVMLLLAVIILFIFYPWQTKFNIYSALIINYEKNIQ